MGWILANWLVIDRASFSFRITSSSQRLSGLWHSDGWGSVERGRECSLLESGRECRIDRCLLERVKRRSRAFWDLLMCVHYVIIVLERGSGDLR